MPDGGAYQRFGAEPRPRIMLLAPSMHGGGAERVILHLVNHCDRSVVDVRLGLLHRSGPYIGELDPACVEVFGPGERWLRHQGDNSSFYRPQRLMVGAVLAPASVAAMVHRFRPDVMVSFMKGMSIVAYGARSALGANSPRWIAREGNNTDVVIDDEMKNPLGRQLVKSLVRRCYRAADCVLANSHEMARGLELNLGIAHTRLRVIHNPIDVERIEEMAAQPLANPPRRRFVVTAGRLEHQKAHDLLIEAFATSLTCRELDLVILGVGGLEAALRAQAAALGVADRARRGRPPFRAGRAASPWPSERLAGRRRGPPSLSGRARRSRQDRSRSR